MQLNNLQIQFNGVDTLEHRITYQNEQGFPCRETLCSGKDFAQHVIDCLEAVPELRTERNDANTQIGEITKMLVEAGLMRRNVNSSIDVLIKERMVVQDTINGIKQLVELPESAGLTELFNAVEALELNKSELNDVTSLLSNNSAMDTNVLTSVHKLLAAQPQLNKSERDALATDLRTLRDKYYTLETQRNELLAAQPQLNEIKYVLHGDIQPCTVLYTDDTTTLLRLDENDMMLETETIEWSDVTTYRCQELLKLSGLMHPESRSNPTFVERAAHTLAQLVRDERIALVDESPVDSDEELLRSAIAPALAPLVVPAAPAAPALCSCADPYVHDNVAYPEADMRAAGWQTEDLVQNGYGHYKPVPMQRPAVRNDDDEPCEECGWMFDMDDLTCPKCAEIRPCAPTTEQQPQER